MGNSNNSVQFGPPEPTRAECYTLALEKFREKVEWSIFVRLAEILAIRDIRLIVGDKFDRLVEHNDIKDCYIINDLYADHKLQVVLTRLQKQPNTCFEFGYNVLDSVGYYAKDKFGDKIIDFYSRGGDKVFYAVYFPDVALLTNLIQNDFTYSEQFIKITNKFFAEASETLKEEIRHLRLLHNEYYRKPNIQSYALHKHVERILANPKIKAYIPATRSNLSNFPLLKETNILFLTEEQLKFFSQNNKQETINDILADFKREFNVLDLSDAETGDHLEEGQQRVSQQQSQEEGRQPELQRSDEIISQIIEGLEADSNH